MKGFVRIAEQGTAYNEFLQAGQIIRGLVIRQQPLPEPGARACGMVKTQGVADARCLRFRPDAVCAEAVDESRQFGLVEDRAAVQPKRGTVRLLDHAFPPEVHKGASDGGDGGLSLVHRHGLADNIPLRIRH